MLGQELGRGLPHEADAQGVDQPPEGGIFAALNGTDDVLGGFFRKTLQGDQVPCSQVVEVADILHQTLIHQLQDDLFTQAVDIHGAFGGEVHDAPGPGPEAIRIGAAGDFFPFRAHQGGVAHRAFFGHAEWLGAGRTFLDNNFHHFRDDVPGPLDQDRVSHPHVFAGHFVFIVERGPGDRDPAHLHRLHHRHGGDRAGAAHVDQDVQHPGGLLGGREFIGQGPAGAPGFGAQALLKGKGIHFDHHPVDFVRQAVALVLQALMVADGRVDAAASFNQGINPEAPFLQMIQDVPVVLKIGPLHLP